MTDYDNIYVISGRIEGWEEDETRFVEASTLDEATRKFGLWLHSLNHSDTPEEVYINFACAVSDYKNHLI